MECTVAVQRDHLVAALREVFENFFAGAIESGGAFLVVDTHSNQVIGSSRYYDWKMDEKSVSATALKLEFSSLGFQKQQVEIGANSIINISMEADIKSLAEIVVVGYGVEQKALLTGSVGIINAETLKDIPVSTVDGIIQGQTAGVHNSPLEQFGKLLFAYRYLLRYY